MIPASSFLLDGDTALMVANGDAIDTHLNRPCDRCYGRGAILIENQGEETCPADCIDGRHTFDVRAEQVDRWDGDAITSYRTFRVHVIDMLPIVDQEDGCPDTAHVCVFHGSMGGEPCEQWTIYDGDCMEQEITLPHAAEPGQWLVRLAVHQ